MEKFEKFIKNHIVDVFMCVAVLFFVVGCWCLYTANRTANDYHHVTDTVQQAEADNREARRQIDSAADQVDSAQKQLRRSIQRTGEITESVKRTKERTDGNSKIIGECEDIVSAGRRDTEEARNIFRDIDERNKTDGTQTDSHA